MGHVHFDDGLQRRHPRALGAIGANDALNGIKVLVGEKERDLDTFVREASTLIARSLVEAGLYPDEARAMVDTWSKSYFRTPGLRVLYVVPRAWTDQLLALELAPAPSELVRVLVGRTEVLTTSEEEYLVARIGQMQQSGKPSTEEFLTEMGRMAEPKLQRVVGIISDAELREFAKSLLAKAKAEP